MFEVLAAHRVRVQGDPDRLIGRRSVTRLVPAIIRPRPCSAGKCPGRLRYGHAGGGRVLMTIKTLALLFTDIEGSTALLTRLEDAT